MWYPFARFPFPPTINSSLQLPPYETESYVRIPTIDDSQLRTVHLVFYTGIPQLRRSPVVHILMVPGYIPEKDLLSTQYYSWSCRIINHNCCNAAISDNAYLGDHIYVREREKNPTRKALINRQQQTPLLSFFSHTSCRVTLYLWYFTCLVLFSRPWPQNNTYVRIRFS